MTKSSSATARRRDLRLGRPQPVRGVRVALVRGVQLERRGRGVRHERSAGWNVVGGRSGQQPVLAGGPQHELQAGGVELGHGHRREHRARVDLGLRTGSHDGAVAENEELGRGSEVSPLGHETASDGEPQHRLVRTGRVRDRGRPCGSAGWRARRRGRAHRRGRGRRGRRRRRRGWVAAAPGRRGEAAQGQRDQGTVGGHGRERRAGAPRSPARVHKAFTRPRPTRNRSVPAFEPPCNT